MFSPHVTFKSESSAPDVQFPVTLPAIKAEQNPEFGLLLVDLQQYLSPEAVSRDLHRDWKQAEETLRHEKHNWLQSHILHRELREIIIDYDLQGQDKSLPVADQEFKEILEQSLNYAEAPDYLPFTPDIGSKTTLLGLEPEDFHTYNPYLKHIPSLQQRLLPELEDRLRRKCENLVGAFHSLNLTDSSNLAIAKSTQLPAMVERSLRIIEERKQQLKATRQKREKQFWTYFQKLMEALGMLETMIKDFRLKKQDKSSEVSADYLTARCDAMCLKIKSVELQILCDTYAAETVEALSKIKHELAEVTTAKERDLHRVKMALEAYTAVGYGFDQLADEYNALMLELENKEWALGELGKSEK